MYVGVGGRVPGESGCLNLSMHAWLLFVLSPHCTCARVDDWFDGLLPACLQDVETSGVLTAGQTVVDRFNFGKKSSNVHLCTSMDVEKFWGIMFEALRAADAASPLNETKNKNS